MPVVRPLAVANSSAAAFGVLRSTSTALLRAISFGVSSAAETLSSAAMSCGFAALALTAGMTLSVFCSFLSSVSTTSWSPATGAQPAPLAALLAEPRCPTSRSRRSRRADRAMVRAARPRAPPACPYAHRARLPCPGAARGAGRVSDGRRIAARKFQPIPPADRPDNTLPRDCRHLIVTRRMPFPAVASVARGRPARRVRRSASRCHQPLDAVPTPPSASQRQPGHQHPAGDDLPAAAACRARSRPG